MSQPLSEQFVLNMRTNVGNLDSTVATLLSQDCSERGFSVCVSNVHMCMEVFDSDEFAQVVNNADLVIPDGRPIYWAQKLLGNKQASQIRGQDIMNRICELSKPSNIKIGLYGGSSNLVLEKVVDALKQQFPGIQITYTYSPPFRSLNDDEERSIIDAISAANVDVLFVGIGCPKQEIWMDHFRPRLKCVMLGVGAAYDFISGEKKHAPSWMQKIGLEWLFRLMSEPSRLWKRYFKHNPRFIYMSFYQVIKFKLNHASR